MICRFKKKLSTMVRLFWRRVDGQMDKAGGMEEADF